MRILLVSQYFWPESFRINDLVQAWTALGHEVTVLTGLPNYPAGRLAEGYSWRGPYRESFAGADVRRVPILTRGPRKGARLIANYASFVASGVALGPLVTRGPFDVTFVYAPSPITICIPAIWLRFLRGTPIAFWVQDLWPDNLSALGAVTSPRALSAVSAMSRWIYRHCDMVLVQSPAFVEPVRRVCPEVGDLRVLPNWADPFYRPLSIAADAPERREWPEGFTVMFAGNLGSAQALDHAIDAADRLRHDGIQWVFVGDGNQRASLESQVRARGLEASVHLLGWRSPETMPRYLACADALLVSLRRDPGFASTVPVKLQTSLAMGRPVLAALAGEGARIVRDAGAGIVVEQESGAALAEGVRALVAAGPEARAAMGAAGRACAERDYDRDTLVARLDGWLRELVEAHR